MVGMSVVDFQRCIKNKIYHYSDNDNDVESSENNDDRHFGDKIC